MESYLSAARDLVLEGMRESQIALSCELEFHLASTLARYMDRPISTDRLTIRLVEAAQRPAWRTEPRRIGDDCLISCAFFAARLTRRGGTIVHYAGLGQTAYEAAGMSEVAGGFPDMLDVLQASGAHISDDTDRRLVMVAPPGHQAPGGAEPRGIILSRRGPEH